MHYYQFNIGDYYAHTHHLDDIENLAYRKMIDYCYLNECCLPDKVEIIAKKIGMRTHTESITNVLEEFFTLGDYGYFQPRIMRDIEKYKDKSEKAKASAAARWSKKPIESDANALQAQTERNANQEPLTNNHKPITKENSGKTKFSLKRAIIDLGVSDEVASHWMTVRKNKKSANTELALKQIITQSEKAGISIVDAINFAASENWASFKAEWFFNSGRNNNNNQPKKTQGTLDDLDNYAENLLL